MAKLFVICGHGAGASGAVGNGFKEADQVRKLGKKIKELGGDSVMLGDVNRNFYKDKGILNLNIPKDYKICELHMDSNPNKKAKGAHVIIKEGLDADGYDNALAKFLGDMFPGRSSKIVGRSDLANVNRAASKGYNYRLVECGFISNADDAKKFNDNIEEIAKGILGSFDIKTQSTPLWYRAHVSGKGWMDAVNGGIAGTTGEDRALEAIKIDMRKLDFKIKARAHIQNIGLQDFGYIKHDTVIGTTGKNLQMEAIELIPEGLKGKKLQVRVHIQDIGWTRWTSGMVGTMGMNKKIEAIELRLV